MAGGKAHPSDISAAKRLISVPRTSPELLGTVPGLTSIDDGLARTSVNAKEQPTLHFCYESSALQVS